MDIEVQTELVAGLPVTVLSGNGYDRIVVRERKLNVSSEANDDYVQRTIAYAVPLKRNGDLKLDFPTPLVEGAPARFQKMFDGDDGARFKSGRSKMIVTPKNVKGAHALLEWVAKQS